MHNKSFSSKPSGLLLLFACLLLSWQAKGQSGFESRIVIQVDDPSVVASVDNPEAKPNETLTLTLTGLTSGKTVEVTAGASAGASNYQETKVKDNNTYTITMPSGVLYINVKVSSTDRVIRIQTPGIGSDLAVVSLSTADASSTISAGKTPVAAGSNVTATLTLNPEKGQTLTLQRITGQSPDGSWTMVPIEVSAAQPVTVSESNSISFKFTMPATEVILTYTISSNANIQTEPTSDDPNTPPVKVPEIAWPTKPDETPVLVITKEVEENKLELLSQELQKLPVIEETPGAITELVDISLQLKNGERVQPNGTVTVTYPYPQGTDETWNFCLLHQISDKADDPVTYETIYPRSLHIGLRFEVTSFSPFAIIYSPPVITEEGQDPVSVKGISLNKSSLTLKKGAGEQLTVTFTPTEATDRRVVWSSDKESVLTVSEDGTLTAVSPGIAKVTARSVNGGFQVFCLVTVEEDSKPGPTPTPDPNPDPDPDPNPDTPVANAAITQDVPRLSVSEGCLQVESARAQTVQVFGLSGREQAMRSSAVSHRITLPSGIWLVRVGGAKAVKILIP